MQRSFSMSGCNNGAVSVERKTEFQPDTMSTTQSCDGLKIARALMAAETSLELTEEDAEISQRDPRLLPEENPAGLVNAYERVVKGSGDRKIGEGLSAHCPASFFRVSSQWGGDVRSVR